MNPHYPLVSARARHLCEYCHAPEAIFNLPFEVEHIRPQSADGESGPDNLALSCRSCNLYKSDAVAAFDEESQSAVRLFHPRLDDWSEHFTINAETGKIQGLTDIGRATVLRLRINSAAQIAARKQWLKLGFLSEQ
jgi:5-methylcytosine-specific restriction endonuclease McrA